MRRIVLDTETTGLEVQLGHRIIELGAVEIVDRRLTGRRFHRYLNPQREIEFGALQVHGITAEFLQDKPKFADVADELLEFVDGAELIIHNAAFDIGFLEHELALASRPAMVQRCASVTDTLLMARDLHPGKRNSLDALCERYQVDSTARTLHGALLDAELLAEVYLAMTRGQDTLLMDLAPSGGVAADFEIDYAKIELLIVRASQVELSAHARQLDEIDKASKGACVWRQLELA
jgi:DNA polymerase-3 subunit epsilon